MPCVLDIIEAKDFVISNNFTLFIYILGKKIICVRWKTRELTVNDVVLIVVVVHNALDQGDGFRNNTKFPNKLDST